MILSKKISNIYLTNKRFPTTWGSSTLLLAHLEAFKQIFEELKWKFSFILNLSESDFPLKSVKEFSFQDLNHTFFFVIDQFKFSRIFYRIIFHIISFDRIIENHLSMFDTIFFDSLFIFIF